MDNNEAISLTPAQRPHFDIYGYVLLENALTSDEVGRMKDALHRIRGTYSALAFM